MIEPLSTLYTLEPTYQPSESTAERIRDKHLLAFIGAFAVGKTTLIHEIGRQRSNYAEVISFTTRAPRGDNDRYRFIGHTPENLQTLANLAQAGELVNFTVHPTTGYVYGTEASDYTAQNCMLATTVKSYQSDKRLSFASVHPIIVVAHPDTWLRRIEARAGNTNEWAARMREAKQSLEWSLEIDGALFVDNSSSSIHDTAARVVDDLENGYTTNHSARQIATSMLCAAINLQ